MMTVLYDPKILKVARTNGIKLHTTFTVDPTDALDWVGRQMNGERSFGINAGPEVFRVQTIANDVAIKDAFMRANRILAHSNAGDVIKGTTAMAALGEIAAQRGLGVLRIAAMLDGRKSPFGFWPFSAARDVIIKGSGMDKKLAQVNADRAASGLPPYKWDKFKVSDIDFKKTADGLTKGLQAAGVALTFIIPPAGIALTGAMAAADAVLSDPNVKKVQDVIDNTKQMASLGDVSAQKGLDVLEHVNGIRKEVGAGPGSLAIKYDGKFDLAQFTGQVTKAGLEALFVAAGIETEAAKSERLAAEAEKAAWAARKALLDKENEAKYAVNKARMDARAGDNPLANVKQSVFDDFFASVDAGTQMRTAAPITDEHYMMTQVKAAKAAKDAAEAKAKLSAEAARKQRAAAESARKAAASVAVVQPEGWFSRLLDWLGF